MKTKEKEYTRINYINDVSTLSTAYIVNGDELAESINRGEFFEEERLRLIKTRKLTPEKGRKWLAETLREMASELEYMPADIITDQWEFKKRELEDIETILYDGYDPQFDNEEEV